MDLPLYFYRDSHKNEIDLLIEDAGVVYPLEIKKYAEPRREDIRLFRVLDDMPQYRRGEGGLICMYDSVASLSNTDRVIPVYCL